MMEATLADGTTTWAKMRAGTVHGHGVVFPRLSFVLSARTPRERMIVQLHVLRAELLLGDELLGQGMLTGIYIQNYDSQLTIEVPVSRAALEHVDQHVTGNRVDVVLRLSGWLHGQDNNEDAHRFETSPQPGERVAQGFGQGRQTDLTFQVARSDWFAQVLEPIGTLDYICMEIAVPRGVDGIRQSAGHLREAERALREGNDPQVFLMCRGAVEALPGAPQHIYDGLSDSRERKALNALLHTASNYFHLGRHTSSEGPMKGEFSVDHADAAFALNLAKLLIAQTARVLTRPSS